MVLAEDEGGPGLASLDPGRGRRDRALSHHDAPDAPQFLRDALAGPALYVAMMASRRRAERMLTAVRPTHPASRMLPPAGHNLGGKAPGDTALSLVAEIVAENSGQRPGGPMRG